jgi:site-specific recombinase XerD
LVVAHSQNHENHSGHPDSLHIRIVPLFRDFTETGGLAAVTEKISGITVVPEPSRTHLNQRQLQDYRNHRRDLIKWMLTLGKNPSEAKGYAHDTVTRRSHDIDAFYRWIWTEHGTYTLNITPEYGNDYLEELAFSDYSDSHKANTLKSLKMLYRWRDTDWDPSFSFTSESSHKQTTAYLTRQERQRIREAVLEYETVPTPQHLSSSERDRWEKLLAQRLRKPQHDITRSDFKQMNGFKFPSIIYTTLDAGLRPKEVGRATTSWVDTQNNVLRIPREDATKGDDGWVVPITQRTSDMLAQWLDERACKEKYEETSKLWLTREAEPFSTDTLNYHAKKLFRDIGLDVDARDLTYYALRHSTGTYMTREEDLVAAADQLRRNTLPTEYDQAPVDDRRDALDGM